MILDLIKKRRAVFPPQFNDKPIAKADLESVLQAANWAPTHARTEPWRFKVLTGESKSRLGSFLSDTYLATAQKPKETTVKKLRENPERSAAVIAICMQRDPKERIPEWEEVAATAMAVQNMWLVCAEMGIGAYWSSPGLITHMHQFLDLEEGEKCLGFFFMGHYDGDLSEGQRQPMAEKVVWMD